MDKKGAIELSVNMIIILILAVVIIGFAIAFITGTFSKSTAKLTERVTEEPDPPRANLDTPITLSRTNIITKRDQTEIIKLSLFNPTSADIGVVLGSTVNITCDKFETGALTPRKVRPNNANTFTYVSNVKGDAGTSVCLIEFGEDSVDFVIKVQ